MYSRFCHIGDKVTIRKDLQAERYYGNNSVTENMLALLGKTCTIQSYRFDSQKKPQYKLVEDIGHYDWTPEMLEQEKPITDIF